MFAKGDLSTGQAERDPGSLVLCPHPRVRGTGPHSGKAASSLQEVLWLACGHPAGTWVC